MLQVVLSTLSSRIGARNQAVLLLSASMLRWSWQVQDCSSEHVSYVQIEPHWRHYSVKLSSRQALCHNPPHHIHRRCLPCEKLILQNCLSNKHFKAICRGATCLLRILHTQHSLKLQPCNCMTGCNCHTY